MTGIQLKALRESKGYSRTQLGVFLGFNVRPDQRVYKLESGNRTITPETEEKINQFFDLHNTKTLSVLVDNDSITIPYKNGQEVHSAKELFDLTRNKKVKRLTTTYRPNNQVYTLRKAIFDFTHFAK